MDQTARPQPCEGQYLGAAALAATVRYARVGQARHALGAHIWGIAVGLELVERPLPGGDVEMVLTPGYGWAGIARPILAPPPPQTAFTPFQNFHHATHLPLLP